MLLKTDTRDMIVHCYWTIWVKLKAFANTANASDSTQPYQQACTFSLAEEVFFNTL